MATNVSAVKVTKNLINDAREAGNTMNRSIGGQIEYWARLGQSLEASPGFSVNDAETALKGEGYTGELIGLERVYAALDGKFDAAQLTEDEMDYFDDLSMGRMNNPTPEDDARFQAYLDKHGRGPGYDEAGNLVE